MKVPALADVRRRTPTARRSRRPAARAAARTGRHGLYRALTVFALLAGLVAMHGFTSHHDMCDHHGLTAMSTTTSAASVSGPVDHHAADPAGPARSTGPGTTWTASGSTHSPTHGSANAAVAAAPAAMVRAIAQGVAVQAPAEVCAHGGGMCLAVLTLLLLLVPLVRGARRRARAHSAPSAEVRWSLLGRGPPISRAPSLFVLCQLRN